MHGRTSAIPVSGPSATTTARAVRGVRQQGVDLLGVGRVVEQEQDLAVGEGGAERLGEVVLVGPGRVGAVQLAQQFPGEPPDGHARAVRFAQPGAQHAVGVTVSDLGGQLLGERGTARTGPARR